MLGESIERISVWFYCHHLDGSLNLMLWSNSNIIGLPLIAEGQKVHHFFDHLEIAYKTTPMVHDVLMITLDYCETLPLLIAPWTTIVGSQKARHFVKSCPWPLPPSMENHPTTSKSHTKQGSKKLHPITVRLGELDHSRSNKIHWK